jgi:transketolase
MLAVDLLHQQGLSVRVLHLSTIKPIDQHQIIETAKRTKMVFTVEEHYIRGGLGSMVSEIVAEEYPTKVIRIGIRNEYSECGKDGDLLLKHELTSETISKRILSEWKGVM